jgi:hypothetical protein
MANTMQVGALVASFWGVRRSRLVTAAVWGRQVRRYHSTRHGAKCGLDFLLRSLGIAPCDKNGFWSDATGINQKVNVAHPRRGLEQVVRA